MYRYLDRPVATLDASDMFLAGAMRCWVAAVRQRRCPCGTLASAFRSRGLAAMMGDFTMAMAAIEQDGTDRLAFAPVPHTILSDDEARLLALFATAREGPRGCLAGMAGALVKPDAVPRLVKAVSFVGAAMRDATA